ncbi:hypothetical protein [Prosthecobacter sp.]|jgi:hypothetical protein|uniref:hypothetical protein n=1 Tax=Prosthecobacter sp. TaxID=1965333 RepID=UPI0025E22A84|nr:hypothetical protein [Prosthecobacter sp.]
MRLLQRSLILCLLGAGLLHSQEKTWPEVEQFSKNITNITWDLRGTNSLKHLRFDGTSFHALAPTGQSRSQFREHAFVDAGVFQLTFGESRAGWYFVSDDLQTITPINISGIVEFKAQAGTATKPVKNFPQDIVNVVWEGRNGETPLKLRWNGTDLEVGAKTSAWHVEKADAVVANRRVLEIQGENHAVVWVAFSQDGTEAWWLTLQDVFGGHAQGVQRISNLTPRATGLSAQQTDLANHADDLLKAGDPMRAATLVRELGRKNRRNEAALRGLGDRFKPLKP